MKRMNEVRGGEVAGLDGHGDEAPGRRRQAPHVYDVRAPDHPRKALTALLARGTCRACLCTSLICLSFV